MTILTDEELESVRDRGWRWADLRDDVRAFPVDSLMATLDDMKRQRDEALDAAMMVRPIDDERATEARGYDGGIMFAVSRVLEALDGREPTEPIAHGALHVVCSRIRALVILARRAA